MSNKSKTYKMLTTYLAAGLFFSHATQAGIVGIRSSSSSSGTSSSATGSVVVKAGTNADEKVVIKEGTTSASCKQDPDSSKYFPLDFFQHITRDGSSLSFEQRPDNKILVKMPASIDTCGKFKPQLYQDPATKSVTVLMQLEDGKTYGDYIKCLTDKNLLVDGKIDHDKIEGKQYSEYSYVLDYSFEKDKDVTKSLKLSYGYPKAYAGKDGYGSTYGLDKDETLPSNLCMLSEKIQPSVTYLNRGRDVLIQDLKDICKSGDAQKIAEARKSIGNADALKDIADKIKSELDDGYLAAVKQDVTRIAADMKKIEDKLTAEGDTMDEATAKKQTAKYADLAKELDTKFLNPAIYRLDTLIKQAADLDPSDAKRVDLDKEIKKLNEEISAFSRRSSTSFASLYSVMEKYAITDTAKTIEDIRLKSFMYGKVYVGTVDEKRGKPLTFEEANQKQVAGLQKFDKTLTDWTDQYLVGKGNMYPIQKTEKERQSVIDKMNKRWNDYQTKEQSNYQKYCSVGWTGSVKNPVQCQTFMSGVESRRNAELKKRDKDLKYIKGRNDKLTKMGTNYNDYQKRKVASEVDGEATEPYGSSYTSYEDNFADKFPGYYGPQTTTAYDPSMYNMGTQPASNMGNTTYNPQMVNAQMPVQPGQYQMQQPQQGGWPSL